MRITDFLLMGIMIRILFLFAYLFMLNEEQAQLRVNQYKIIKSQEDVDEKVTYISQYILDDNIRCEF